MYENNLFFDNLKIEKKSLDINFYFNYIKYYFRNKEI